MCKDDLEYAKAWSSRRVGSFGCLPSSAVSLLFLPMFLLSRPADVSTFLSFPLLLVLFFACSCSNSALSSLSSPLSSSSLLLPPPSSVSVVSSSSRPLCGADSSFSPRSSSLLSCSFSRLRLTTGRAVVSPSLRLCVFHLLLIFWTSTHDRLSFLARSKGQDGGLQLGYVRLTPAYREMLKRRRLFPLCAWGCTACHVYQNERRTGVSRRSIAEPDIGFR